MPLIKISYQQLPNMSVSWIGVICPICLFIDLCWTQNVNTDIWRDAGMKSSYFQGQNVFHRHDEYVYKTLQPNISDFVK